VKNLNLNELFEYCEGHLYWKSKPSNRVNIKVGDLAGYKNAQDYMAVGIHGRKYKNHRIIFFMHHGYIPDEIDHIDGNTLNNKIENLREATHAQNMANKKQYVNSLSGVKGVSWHKAAKKWYVQIRSNQKHLFQGLFNDLELAELVAIEARNKYHGQFARHK